VQTEGTNFISFYQNSISPILIEFQGCFYVHKQACFRNILQKHKIV